MRVDRGVSEKQVRHTEDGGEPAAFLKARRIATAFDPAGVWIGAAGLESKQPVSTT